MQTPAQTGGWKGLKMAYKLELHAHTSEISRCASATAEVLVEKYRNAGYNGVVITNHFDPETLEALPGDTWASKVRSYGDAVRHAADVAADIDIFFGCELRMRENMNDYLLFGVSEEFLASSPDIFSLGIKKLHEFCNENGISVYQAHPFRNRMTICDPRMIDGIEVFNGHRGHDSRNEIAARWAERYGLPVSSGSDFHDPFSAVNAGIETDFRIASQNELREVLQSGSFRLLTDVK